MLVKRDILDKVTLWIGEPKILIIKGARQTGKTTLLRQLENLLKARGDKTAYFSVDQDLDNPMYADARLFIQFLKDQRQLGAGKKLFVFLDEFQYIAKAGLFLKSVFDQHQADLQLIVSGSSTLDIAANSEFLTGRKIDFLMTPFSFSEFLAARSEQKLPRPQSLRYGPELENFYRLYRVELETKLTEFINWGGYPEVAVEAAWDKRLAILKDIVKTYVEKDVALFLRVENISGFNNVIKVLAAQTGNLVNREEISATLGLNQETVRKYLEILAGTFIFSFVRPFFTNIRKELSKMPKVYAADLGIVKIVLGEALVQEYRLLSGMKVENFVFNELVKMDKVDATHFYRTISKSEIDFIVKDERGLWPIEAKFRVSASKLPLAIKNFKKYYGAECQQPMVITQQDLKQEAGALFIPAAVWPFVKWGN